jgi:adenylate cyclase
MPERVHRRLAAIVAADVVGYSRSIEADEAGTLARLQSVRCAIFDPALQRHDGRVVKTIGDGLLLEFPSVIEATQAATEIQTALASRNAACTESERILYRVGINLGDVVVDDGDLLGDGVNVAARLEALAEPGGICLSESVYEQLAGRLDLPLVDAGPQQLKNIARPVRIFRWRPGGHTVASSARRYGTRKRAAMQVGMAIVTMAAAASAWWMLDGRAPDSARTAAPAPAETRLRAQGRTAVAVLPFANLGGDAARDYFSDGLTEDVIGALGRFSGISVLSRNAVMAFKGKTPAVSDIGRILGVRYLVEGSVRHGDGRVRVSVQLSDATAGRLLWSEQFDGEMHDVIGVQEKVARRIVGILAVRLTRAEQARTAALPTANLQAYDLVMRGRARLALQTRRANVEARMMFQQAIALDSQYADAYVGLGLSYRVAMAQGWVPDPAEALTKAEEAAREAIKRDDRNSRAYALLGRLMVLRQEFDQAKEVCRRAIELNPSDAEGYLGLGAVLLWASDIDGAIEALETARAYDPMTDSVSVFYLAFAYYLAGRSEAVINYIDGMTGRQGQNVFTHVILSLAYAELGKQDEANEARAQARRLNPAFDPERFGTLLRDPKQQIKIRAGLKKAGWL